MRDIPAELIEIGQKHPCRYTSHEKERFLLDVKRLLKKAGYSDNEIHEQRCRDIFGTRNLIIGSERADFIITAHYDTPGRNGFMLFTAPIFGQTGANIILMLMLLPLAVLEAALVIRATDNPSFLSIAAAVLIVPALIAAVALIPMLFSNPNNSNDNTSGVLCLLQSALAAAEDQGLRKRCCFILFDNEEWGLIGSMAYSASRTKQGISPEQSFVINLDSVGVGDILAAVRACPKNRKPSSKRYDALVSSLSTSHTEFRELCSQLVFMSDHAVFTDSVMLSRMHHSRSDSLYIPNIHTRNDTDCDYGQIAELAHLICSYINNYRAAE